MMRLADLRILQMKNPLGIDRTPYFSWKMISDRKNVFQKIYRLRVWDEAERPVWDSGEIRSRENAFIPYEGEQLQSRTCYRVTVTVTDNYDESAETEGCFETAFLEPGDWKARWVSSPIVREDNQPGFGKQQPPVMFRKHFQEENRVTRARLHATCHGIYQLYLNGARIDDREFAPEHTVYEKYLCYQTYDVTEAVRQGENVIGMYVGDGWYLCPNTRPDMEDLKQVHEILFQLELTLEDGSRRTVCSDGEVKASCGPVRSSDLFAGEYYDAACEQNGWSCPDFDDSAWIRGNETGETMKNLRAQLGEPVKAYCTLPVKEILHSAKGETILDFGQTISGRVRMHMDLPEGETVTLEHTETLDQNGCYYDNILSEAEGIGNGADQKDVFRSAGRPQIYEPLFTFHGFRYVRVTCFQEIFADQFEAVVLTTEKENAGIFRCSDERINRLYENTRWSQRSNMMSIPTDCPQREKAGWTGDVQIYGKTAMLNEEVTAFFTRWLENVAADQDEFGKVPMVVPYNGSYPAMGRMFGSRFGFEGKATSAGWGDVAVLLPYTMYEITGNKEILKQQYESAKKWCDYIIKEAREKHPPQCTRPAEIEEYLWDTGFHYGEWLIPSFSKEGGDANQGTVISMLETSKYTAPIFGWYSVSTMAETAAVLGKEEDQAYYYQIAERMKYAIGHGVIGENGGLPIEMMGAYVLLLYFDLLPEEWKERYEKRLVQMIVENGNCLDTGFLATPYILDTLVKIGRKDVAYRLLWQDQCPSWLYEVNHGATTMWESWYTRKPDGTPLQVSHNHYSFGCVDDWLFRHVAGIEMAEPGFRRVVIRPDCHESFDFCERSFETVNGRLFLKWERTEEGKIHMELEVPCNMSAVVEMEGQKKEVGSGKYQF